MAKKEKAPEWKGSSESKREFDVLLKRLKALPKYGNKVVWFQHVPQNEYWVSMDEEYDYISDREAWQRYHDRTGEWKYDTRRLTFEEEKVNDCFLQVSEAPLDFDMDYEFTDSLFISMRHCQLLITDVGHPFIFADVSLEKGESKTTYWFKQSWIQITNFKDSAMIECLGSDSQVKIMLRNLPPFEDGEHVLETV